MEQNVGYQASLIRDHLPAYLDFVGREVLPVMSRNIDEIVYDLKGLTDIRPGLFYHGHIDYSLQVSGGIEGLMDTKNLVLQYHTLENPLTYLPYWRQELGNLHDQDIDAWLERIHEYNQAISTPGATSEVSYTPLTKQEAVDIASRWDDYRRQNGLASPGLEMLTQMVYLVEGGQQPFYQEAFKDVYRFHSIAFSAEGYRYLDNQIHLENTFSPFQITFEHLAKCQVLLPVLEAARAANIGYILNPHNVYAARYLAALHGNASLEMARLSLKLDPLMRSLPDENLVKISTASRDQWIALFVEGDYIFVVSGTLDAPSIFH